MITRIYLVLLSFTGFYWALLDFTEILGFTGNIWFFMNFTIYFSFTGFHQVLSEITSIYWILFIFADSYQLNAMLVFNEFVLY